jgi:hypothetical protein
MTFWIGLALVSTLAALGPALLFFHNLRLYRRPPYPLRGVRLPAVSVLIPARDEEDTIGGALTAVLRSERVELEVVVLDDGSRDRTAEIVREIAERDPRVRLETAPPLPAGWCGKQHACAVLARHARHPVLVFQDADVRLAPDALGRAVTFLEASGAGLASGFPRQVTVTPLERLLLPMMHWILLAFLPFERMRRSRHPAYAAGCGQLFVAWREDYERAGGHTAIRDRIHDGLHLPRVFREAGIATDLFDAADVASCRMYHDAAGVWNGLVKNAVEGLAAPGRIVPATLLLLCGQVLPFALAGLALAGAVPAAAGWIAAPAMAAAWLPRLAAARRFHQPVDGALLHPLGILVFLAIQGWALARHLAGRPAAWKGRAYAARRTVSAPWGHSPRRNGSAAAKNSLGRSR